MTSQFQDFETALIRLGGTGVPLLRVDCHSREITKTVLDLLLARTIFSQLFGQARKVYVILHEQEKVCLELLPYDILSAPTQFTLNDVTISLNTTQRAEWLLCEQKIERDAHLHELLHAAQAGASAT